MTSVGTIDVGDGSASTPSFTFGSDLNTGMFSAAADAIGWATGGTVQMQLDSSGNLGVGATPSVKFHAKSSTGEVVRIETTTARGGGSVFAAFQDPTGRKGYVGYGATTDDFHVSNGLSGDLIFRTDDTDRGRFNSAGKFLIGTSSTLGSLAARQYIKPAGSTTEFGIVMQPTANWSGGSGPMAFVNVAGTSIGSITATSTATSFNTSSDERLKTLIEDAVYDPNWIYSLKPRRFEFKAAPGEKHTGFIAQELELVAPEAVTPGDGDPNKAPGDEGFRAAGVDYSKLVPLLILEVQRLRARLDALEAP